MLDLYRETVAGPAAELVKPEIGGNTGPERRETIYYRLQAHGHRDRWREVVTDPLSEFREG